MHDSPADAREHVAESPDIEQPGRGIRPRRLQQDVVGLVAAAARRRSRSVETVTCRPVFSLPGWRFSIRPEISAQLRNMRFSS